MKESSISYGFQSKRETVFPVLIQLALVHYICNSRCKKCPVGLYKRGELGQDNRGEFDPKKRKAFPFTLFLEIADEMAKYPWSILRLHGRGEPLMHPYYVEMIDYAKKAGVGTVTSFTNGVLLNKEKAERILDAGLDLLEISIDAYSEDFYRKARGTDFFNKVIKNAKNFIKERNRRKKYIKTRVIVSAVDCPEFQKEKKKFLKFWKGWADMVIFRPYHTYGGRLAPLKERGEKDALVPCAQLWTRFSINPWGRVNACFNDWSDEEIVGDLNEINSTIFKIWRSKKFEDIRKSSLEGKSILKCCGNCLATKEGWTYSYQLLLEKLKIRDS